MFWQYRSPIPAAMGRRGYFTSSKDFYKPPLCLEEGGGGSAPYGVIECLHIFFNSTYPCADRMFVLSLSLLIIGWNLSIVRCCLFLCVWLSIKVFIVNAQLLGGGGAERGSQGVLGIITYMPAVHTPNKQHGNTQTIAANSFNSFQLRRREF
jgi:hypothetical protein